MSQQSVRVKLFDLCSPYTSLKMASKRLIQSKVEQIKLSVSWSWLLLEIEPSWCYCCRDCSAQEISPGQECLCSWAKQGWMEEEIEECEKADEWMGTEEGQGYGRAGCRETHQRAEYKWKCNQHKWRTKKTDEIKWGYVHSCKICLPVWVLWMYQHAYSFFKHICLFIFYQGEKPCQLKPASFLYGKSTMTIAMTGRRGLRNVFLSSEYRMLSTEFAINALSNGLVGCVWSDPIHHGGRRI